MTKPTLRRPLLLLVSVVALTFSGWAAADPPTRAARLGYVSGSASFSPAGEPEWVQAVVNRPLTTGDRLWADTGSRAELQVGGAAIRLGELTSVTLLNVDDRIVQVQLSQGTLKVRVRWMRPDQTFEVDTPNLALTLRRPGDYRIEVDSNDDATAVRVQSGEADAYGEGRSYAIDARQGYRFFGTDLSDYDLLGAQRSDDFDRWASERDRRDDNSPSARYVSPEVVGYEDLDASGTWHRDPDYGNVWTPSRIAADWTPYRDGHWAWVDPWGWTWVDDAAWGFAVSHYGRWANIRGSWGWVPGPPHEQAVYAPALVAFIGGGNLRVAVTTGGAAAAVVGWFPLAPRDVYQPSYRVSRGYFDNVNRSNAVIAPATVTNIYNSTQITTHTTIVNKSTNVVKVVYANQQVTGAVIAVPEQAFLQSRPVARVAMPLSREAVRSAPVQQVAAVAPVQQSVRGGAPMAAAKPPVREKPVVVVARSAPPPPPVAFAAQQKELAARPGRPIEDVQRTQLKPAAPALATKAVVVTSATAPAPTALPPAKPPAGKSPEARKAEAAKPAAGKAEATGMEAAKAAQGKAEAATADAAKADTARAASSKAEAAKAEAAKAEATKAEAAKAGAAKAEAARADAAKAAEAARVEAAKSDAAKAASAKADAARAEAARANAAQADAARAGAARAEAARAAAAKVEAARTEAAKAEAARAEVARAASARTEAAKAEAARAEAAKNASAKADAARAEAAKAEVAKAASAKADAATAASPRTPPAASATPAARGNAPKVER